MKGLAVGLVMVAVSVIGLILMLVFLGGNSPPILTSIDTRARIGIADSLVGIAGVFVLLFCFWREGQ